MKAQKYRLYYHQTLQYMLTWHYFMWISCICGRLNKESPDKKPPWFITETAEDLARLWNLIDAGVAYMQSMKISLISTSLVTVFLLFLCMESCCSFTIDRDSRDTSDSLNMNNCNNIRQSFIDAGRCACDLSFSSVVSTVTGGLACVANRNIDTRKYTLILL